MAERARQFVESFEKTLDVLWENKPKWLTFAVYVYARDTEDKTELSPDGRTCHKFVSNTTKYDDYYIRHNLDQLLLWEDDE